MAALHLRGRLRRQLRPTAFPRLRGARWRWAGAARLVAVDVWSKCGERGERDSGGNRCEQFGSCDAGHTHQRNPAQLKRRRDACEEGVRAAVAGGGGGGGRGEESHATYGVFGSQYFYVTETWFK